MIPGKIIVLHLKKITKGDYERVTSGHNLIHMTPFRHVCSKLLPQDHFLFVLLCVQALNHMQP